MSSGNKGDTPTFNANLITLCEDDDAFHQLMSEANMEEYFAAIEPFTFKSTFFPLSVSTAQAIVDTYPEVIKLPLEERKTYHWQSNALLSQLASDIDAAKATLGCDYIFVRTSSRSPKDAALGEKGLPIYIENFKKLQAEQAANPHPKNTLDNMRLIAAYVMGTKALKVHTGEEAVFLLINSERLQEDLEHYIKNPDQLYQICVRQFMDFEVELEFRGFVYKNKLTAITQYNEYCFFPGVVQHKEEILQKLTEWTKENLIGKVGLQSFVIDYMLISSTPHLGPFSNMVVYIVEINPLAEFAGSGLFTWEKDKPVLLGALPFEFRVAEAPMRAAIKLISPEWARYIKKADEIIAAESQ